MYVSEGWAELRVLRGTRICTACTAATHMQGVHSRHAGDTPPSYRTHSGCFPLVYIRTVAKTDTKKWLSQTALWSVGGCGEIVSAIGCNLDQLQRLDIRYMQGEESTTTNPSEMRRRLNVGKRITTQLLAQCFPHPSLLSSPSVPYLTLTLSLSRSRHCACRRCTLLLERLESVSESWVAVDVNFDHAAVV